MLASIYVEGLASEKFVLENGLRDQKEQKEQEEQEEQEGPDKEAHRITTDNPRRVNILIADTVNALLAQNKSSLEKGISNNIALRAITDKSFTMPNLIALATNPRAQYLKTSEALENHVINPTHRKQLGQQLAKEGLDAVMDKMVRKTKKEIEKQEFAEQVHHEEKGKEKEAVTAFVPR